MRFDGKGIDLALLKQAKQMERGRLETYAERRGGQVAFVPGRDAAFLVDNGCVAVGEGANMPTTPEAIKVFLEAGVAFGPGKAANAGGVATSALEMQQNASRDSWSFDFSERRLRDRMRDIHARCLTTAAEYRMPGNDVAGATIDGFRRVADAMLALGLI
ncbi:NADP-specific glutamate dehydrogenase [[Actinomadura] parvosata subsp. kistnae]|uniref:Glutamate/phenylalanine/leucine/valine/L-tryptophan dehydrogenase C-terminal domain-containing protein n=1 Tax=[Actinomadura] parvosata subsp. kistnae TaxID=1909395 RepID=A0A1V0AGZ2_9ACTN|nr:hypothetical protein BKM31_55545 [Nonomuraea sp. ATCC 55076]SPL91873.1 NADP-specific glutamate dehydrogenase [Actinomadura parvosata subsp. kistnae]